MMSKKKIVLVTSTRADYGKLKSIILKLEKNKNLKTKIFVTGMHNMNSYGKTVGEIKKDKINSCFCIEGGSALHIKNKLEYKSINFGEKKRSFKIFKENNKLISNYY